MLDLADVLDFWLQRLTPADWYVANPAIDAEIIRQFADLWAKAQAGGLIHWGDTDQGALAYLIVTDQFPRNMFRGAARAFATDAAARQMARGAIARGRDLAIPEPQRVFFYMPFEHSEDLADQDWSVALMEARLTDTDGGYATHARAHREVIRRYGRFPFRNAALDRTSTIAEQAFLDAGGYAGIVKELAG